MRHACVYLVLASLVFATFVIINCKDKETSIETKQEPPVRLYVLRDTTYIKTRMIIVDSRNGNECSESTEGTEFICIDKEVKEVNEK